MTVEADDLRSWAAWHEKHQPFELQWWKEALANGHSMDDDGFRAHWQPVKDWIKPRGTILDIGCGPRPAFAPCIVIDPLATDYQAITPQEWWLDVEVHNACAENFIPGLMDTADTVICWNALDHAIGWQVILENMLSYGTEGARFAVATDFHEPFLGHPGFDIDEFEAEIDGKR